MIKFFRVLGEVLSAILYAVRKAQERKRMDQNLVSRTELDSDPVAWYKRLRYHGANKDNADSSDTRT